LLKVVLTKGGGIEFIGDKNWTSLNSDIFADFEKLTLRTQKIIRHRTTWSNLKRYGLLRASQWLAQRWFVGQVR